MAKSGRKRYWRAERPERASIPFATQPDYAEPGDDMSDPDSVWEMLARDVRMDPTEAEPIKMGFVKRLFSALYDHLGSLILLNLAVALQVLLGVAVGLAFGAVLFASSIVGIVVAALIIIAVAAPAFAGMFNYARCLFSEDESATLSRYVAGMRALARRSWALMGLQAATGGLLVLSVRFYASLGGPVAFGAELLILFLLVVWAMAGCYAWPLLARGLEMSLILRNSIALAMVAPGSTIVMLVGLLAVSTLFIVIPVGAVLLLFAVWAVTENASTSRLVRVIRERQEALARRNDGADST